MAGKYARGIGVTTYFRDLNNARGAIHQQAAENASLAEQIADLRRRVERLEQASAARDVTTERLV